MSGTDVRLPSTANFLVDSLDRANPATTTSQSFSIVSNQSLMNGFFTRLAVSEVMLDYGVPNIQAVFGNSTITVAVLVNTTWTNYSATITDGFYTIANALTAVVSALNTATSGVATWSIVNSAGSAYVQNPTATSTNNATATPNSITPSVQSGLQYAYLKVSGSNVNSFLITQSTTGVLNLGQVLDFPSVPYQSVASSYSGGATTLPCVSPSLLGVRYVDIVCNNLTYNQALKDTSTNQYKKDVLYRWVLAWGDSHQLLYDVYNYPILQGYTPFRCIRQIAFPKQVRWSPNMPIGNLTFELFMNGGSVLPTQPGNGVLSSCEYQMNLLVSEV